jgi:hypothetical protein
MTFRQWYKERIVAICRDNIYRPVLPQVSPVIDNPHLPGHKLVVVRVDESRDAPHAVNDGRHIYERTGSQGKPYDFAHIDHIEHLLRRRQKVEEEREASIERAIERATHQLVGRRLHHVQPMGVHVQAADTRRWMQVPLRWASVIPYYPWRDLCTPQACYDRHRVLLNAVNPQRVPGGSYAVEGSPQAGANPRGRSSLTAKGHVFAIECAYEAELYYAEGRQQQRPTTEDFWVNFDKASDFLRRVLHAAAGFYGGRVEVPGHLMVSVGLLDVRHYRMCREARRGEQTDGLVRGARFPDERFRADFTTDAAAFMKNPDEAGQVLLDQLAYGFDL